jgi:ABC-type transporter Mla MlaB component
VTVRFTVTEDRACRRIRLEGRLSADEIAELEQLVGVDPRRAGLDLAELRSADASGLALLRRLRREGVDICGAPPHLVWRIEEDSE